MLTQNTITEQNNKATKWILIPYATLLISVWHYINVFTWGGGAESFKLGFIIWPICAFAGIIIYFNAFKVKYTFSSFFLLYTFYYIICVFFSSENTTNKIITECVYGALLFSLTIIFMNYCAKNGIVKEFNYGIMIALPFAFIEFLNLVDSLNTSSARTYNPVFYLLYFLPFAFLEKKRVIKYIELAIIFIAVILSYKRTALITLVIIALFVFYKENKEAIMGKKSFVKVLFLTLIACVGVYLIYTEIISRNSNLNWNDRMEDLAGGAGRPERWESFFADMRNANFLQLIFGHGVVYPLYHNDLLQVTYNSGIIGVLFYIGMSVQLLVIYFKMSRANYQHTMAYATSLIIFFFDSAVGQVIVVHTWTLQLVVFWGIILGDFYRDSKLKGVKW